MSSLRFVLLVSAVAAFTIKNREPDENIRNEGNFTTPIKGHRLQREGERLAFLSDEDDGTDEPMKGKTKMARFRRNRRSEEEYDYFYEYESDDYRKESRSFSDRGEDPEISPCPGNSNGTYPVPGRPGEYLVCVSGRPFARRCPEGLGFRSTTDRCHLPRYTLCNYACRFGSERRPSHEKRNFTRELCPVKCTSSRREES